MTIYDDITVHEDMCNEWVWLDSESDDYFGIMDQLMAQRIEHLYEDECELWEEYKRVEVGAR